MKKGESRNLQMCDNLDFGKRIATRERNKQSWEGSVRGEGNEFMWWGMIEIGKIFIGTRVIIELFVIFICDT